MGRLQNISDGSTIVFMLTFSFALNKFGKVGLMTFQMCLHVIRETVEGKSDIIVVKGAGW